MVDIIQPPLHDPQFGYNQVARYYDAWEWQEFWSKNEFPWLLEELASLPQVRSVLDIGCGTGRLLKQLQDFSYHLAGIDVSQEMLNIARARLLPNVDLHHGSATLLPWSTGSFDVVIAGRVLSHVPECFTVLKEGFRVTSATGFMLITDVHPSHDYKIGHTRIYGDWGQVAIQTYRHTVDDVLAAAAQAGWKCLKSMTVTAKNVTWLPAADQLPSLDRQGVKPVSFRLLLGK